MRAGSKSVFGSLAAGALLVVAACNSNSNTNNLTGQHPAGTGSTGNEPAAVKTYGCQNCHGTDMSGVTSPLPDYTPNQLYPPNLTPDATGIGTANSNGWTDQQLEYAIRNGVDNNGEVLCPQMQHFKNMTESDMTTVIAWLRSLKPVKKNIPGSICPPLKTAPGM
jgi:hypothetical protein